MIEINNEAINKEKLLQELEYQKQNYRVNKKKQDCTFYTLESFMRYSGKEFVANAYERIVKEQIDPQTLDFYLSRLESGYYSKTDIIGMIRFSPNGKAAGVRINGIKKRFFLTYLSHIPKIGYFFKLLFIFAKLPKLAFRLNRLENRLTLCEQQHKQEKEQKMQDAFYIDFENNFRGSKEVVKQRQSFYLPYVKEVLANDDDYVLDIGCGRGEWLELLQENNIKAKGVDLNRVMVEQALQNGLDVTYADAISYLRSCEKESIKVIGGFHIVEHLEFDKLIALFDVAYYVLKKGGMLFFETPNPENLFVGACSFYTDPTHIKPIPSATLRFLAQNRGFENVKVHKLHPLKKVDPISDEALNHLLQSAFCAQDYSIMGYKR